MTDFDKTYWHSMDKQAAEMYQLNPGSLSLCTPPFEKQLKALKARIFEGASNVELGFMGHGKGSIKGGNITPEMHGKLEREDMRMLAKVNQVGLTTHASASAMGMAGFTQQGFQDEAMEANLHEVERAIEFAADVAEGGPVVIHTGEFPRAISEAEKDKPELFKAFPDEPEKMVHRLVNTRTGQIFTAVREDERAWIVKPLEKDGKPVQRKLSNGDPMWIDNPITGKQEPIYYAQTDAEGRIEVDEKKYKDFKEEKLKDDPDIDPKLIPKLFFWEHMRPQIEAAMGQADEYETNYKTGREASEQIRELIEHYKELEKGLPEEALEKLKVEALKEASRFVHNLGLNAPGLTEKKLPTEILKAALWQAEKLTSYGQEIASSQRRQAKQLLHQLSEVDDMETYAVKRSADTIARAAMFAYDVEKKQKLPKPMYIAPENVFPEQYGAHPDELRDLIVKSREAMAERLKKKGMGEGEAKQVASEHIKATFDIGHANTWKKYFEGKEEDFNKWMAEKVVSLVKEGIIGHVHVSDNFGYEDEHVSPGEGSAPIMGMIKLLREHGYQGKFVVEPGAQEQTIDALRLAMRHFHSPIYKIDGASMDWAEIEHSYFGKTVSPYGVIGAYAPDVDLPTEHRTWTFWSGVPME